MSITNDIVNLFDDKLDMTIVHGQWSFSPKKLKILEADRGKSTTTDQAYREGYAAKYDQWANRDNPYALSTATIDLANAFDEGYAEAVNFAC